MQQIVPSSIIPRQCSAITTKGKRCRKEAILGASQCAIHSRPSPSDAPSVGGLRKVALAVLAEAAMKFGFKALFEFTQQLYTSGVLRGHPPLLKKQHSKVRIGDIDAWYEALQPSEKEKALQALAAATARMQRQTQTIMYAGEG